MYSVSSEEFECGKCGEGFESAINIDPDTGAVEVVDPYCPSCGDEGDRV